jgi:hypothetical protein
MLHILFIYESLHLYAIGPAGAFNLKVLYYVYVLCCN